MISVSKIIMGKFAQSRNPHQRNFSARGGPFLDIGFLGQIHLDFGLKRSENTEVMQWITGLLA
jgi:hypothetical protein